MSHLKNARILLALLAVSSLTLFALPPTSSQMQAQMNQSAGQSAGKADAQMSAAYKRLRGVLDAPQKAQLTLAQVAWIKFRDAEAALLSSKAKGGSVYLSVYAVHRREITQERTRELEKAYRLFTTEGAM